MKRIACALALALAAAAGAPRAGAGSGGHAGWQERVQEARDAVEQARARRDAAEDAYDEMRHRKYPRGDARAGVEAERSAAREALTEAQRNLDTLLDQARRAGVPPGWVRAPEATGADAADVPASPDDGGRAKRANLPFGKPAGQ
jgi:multidrug resistance efflux pump